MNANGITFGCMIFDSTQEHGAGWAATAEQQEATRRRGTGDLASDTVWLTNLDYDTTARAGLANNVRFRRADYMREPLYQIARRHHIDNPHELAQFGAQVFDRVIRLAMHLLKMEYVPRFALRNGIRSIIFGQDPCFPLDVYNAISEAISYNTNCERPYRPEEETIRYFKLPQRDHARTVLSTPLPAGNFARWEGTYPTSSSESIEWMRSLQKPGIFKITAKNFDDTFNRLINYGDSPASDRSQRRWVTNEELILIAGFSEVCVLDAFVAERTLLLNNLIRLLDNLPDAADMSLAVGLIAENIWAAAGTNNPNRTAETAETKSINPYTPFLRSMDRFLCLSAAQKIDAMGFEVVGYSTGAIRVNCHEKSDAEIVTAAIHTGCIPPSCNMDIKSITEIFNNSAPTPLSMMQTMYACGLTSKILSTDSMVTNKILTGN